jgi:hypothetical protein
MLGPPGAILLSRAKRNRGARLLDLAVADDRIEQVEYAAIFG